VAERLQRIPHKEALSMIPFRRILVPHDFSDPATEALKVAARLAPDTGRLVVLHVVVPVVPLSDIPPAGISTYIAPGELISGAKRQLERAIAKALPGKRGPEVEGKVVIGDPYQRIMDATRGMDLVVMSTAGRTGLSHLLIGSVTEKVVRHSPIPVMTLRGTAARKAANRSTKSRR
jgi:nucleotide-binding universal stress UspA family protein